jgi:uncharacterized iron-regulated protein
MTSARGNRAYFFSYVVKAGTFFSYLCSVIRFLKQERKYRVVFSKFQCAIGFYLQLIHHFFVFMKFLSAKRSIVTLILLITFCANAFPQSASSYKIYQTATKKIITIDELVKALNKTNVVFFGEEHNDSISHVLEATILQKLNEAHPKQVALSMEMFETDCQTVLNEYLTGLIREKNFVTDARTWPNYKDYRPLVEYAKENHLPVIAANAPSRYTNMVSRLSLKALNQLDKVGKSYLPPLPIDTATGAYLVKFDQIMGAHTMGGMEMYQAQNLWDATMGWSVASFLKTHAGFTIFHINGGFHSEEKLGAVSQLKKYQPNAVVKNIAAFGSENFAQPDWNKLSKSGDFVILTTGSGTKDF